MEAIHWSAWVGLAIGVIAVAWFLGGSLDEQRRRNIHRLEQALIWFAGIALVGLVVWGLVALFR